MSRISQLINEIRETGPEPSHRNALQIHKILEANQKLFAAVLDADAFNHLLKNFEGLAESSAREFNSQHFKDEYSRAFNLLRFYVEKVI